MNGTIVGRKEPLEGWAIVLAVGNTFVGQWDRRHKLSPVYELKIQAQIAPDGVQLGMGCLPVLMMTIGELEFGTDAVFIRIEDLAKEEREGLAKAVKQAATLVEQIRASRSGITVAHTLPRGGVPGSKP